MRTPQFMLAVTLLVGGSVFAGPNIDKNVITPEPICGPWYVSVYGGGSFFDGAEFSGPFTTGTASFDNGWIAGIAVGLRTENQMRFELDINHTQAPADQGSVSFFGVPFGSGDAIGDVERTSLFLNAVKEFGSGRLHPYIGAGIGLSNVQADIGNVFLGKVGEADDVVLGYQFMSGVAFDVSECLQAYAEYRLMGQGDLEDASVFNEMGSLDLGWGQHAILGVRWFF